MVCHYPFSRLGMRRAGGVDGGRYGRLLRDHGVRTVVVSRFLPAVRVLTPVWAVGHVALGAFAGASIKRIEEVVGAAGWILLAVVVLVGGAVYVSRRRRSARGDSGRA